MKKIDYSIRSEYVVKYDASDRSGNKAEQVWFSLILDDPIAPKLSLPMTLPKILQAGDRDNVGQDSTNLRYWLLPTAAKATDNYDGDLTTEVQIVLTIGNQKPNTFTQAKLKGKPLKIDTHTLGEVQVKYSVYDHAGMFGKYGVDNKAELSSKINIIDNVPPQLYCKKSGCAIEKYQLEGAYNTRSR